MRSHRGTRKPKPSVCVLCAAQNNYEMVTMDFPSLHTVSGHVRITENHKLLSNDGFSALKTVGSWEQWVGAPLAGSCGARW